MRRIIGCLFISGALLTAVFFINSLRVQAERQGVKVPKQVQDEKKIVYTKDGQVFDTHLPVVLINSNGQRIEKQGETWVEISVIDPSSSAELNTSPDFTAHAVIEYRGDSSYSTFDKKQYHIEFKEGPGIDKDRNYSVMGMGAASDWVLNAPFLDRTLVRNRLVYSLSRELLDWSPDTRYCELFLDGKYQGLYLMVESVTNEESRLNLTRFGLLSGKTAYILKRDRPYNEENEIDTYGVTAGRVRYRPSISYPSPERLTERQLQWIQNDISEFERALYSSYFDDPKLGYRKYIDIDSFIDYYIINEFTLTTDAGYLSTFVYKEINGKLKMTVWDFNNSFDNYAGKEKSPDKFYVAESNWYNRLFNDRKFAEAVIIRYRELRKGVLGEENLLRMVDENVKYIGAAKDRNFELWGYTFYEGQMSLDEQGNSRDPESFEEAVQQLKKCIIARGSFLDENIEMLYKYSEK